jgi:hypothetical protein
MTFWRRRPLGVACFVAVCLLMASPLLIADRENHTGAPASPVEPLDLEDVPGWSFRNHVIPVLTKAGCNSGACHGAAAGKNGFALTLRGYDPEADYDAITRQAAGRRVNRLEPAKSLILLKPTEVLPHMGGRRIEPGSLEYRVLARWIARGVPAPSRTDPILRRLELSPERQTMQPGQRVPLRVFGHFSDGRAEDVTRWARYTSGDESVAEVNDQGIVAASGPGETGIAVQYLNEVAVARVTSPFADDIDPAVYERASGAHVIDEFVLRKLKDLRLAPAGLAGDREFIRRAFLDAAGILPAPEEVERFVSDARPDKRTRLVADLVERPEFVDYWAYKWSDLLLVSSRGLGRANMQAYYRWVRESVARNKPWDQFVRELTVASGRSDENGAVNYFLIHRSPIDLAENYTQAFLGLTLTCARCHNHPLEKWTQRDYYAFANLFSRVSHRDDSSAFGKVGVATIVSASQGDILHPRTGEALAPQPLDGIPLPPDAVGDRRAYLAEWLTAPDNILFARAVVNRVWANFFGRGLVDPVDDLRATNPASNEELFEAVTREFVAGGFDIKALIVTIMTSATYQRSSVSGDANASDDRFYSRYLIRRLPAEVILDAVSQITGVPEKFSGYPVGTRALQLPDTRVSSYFLDVFGRPERLVTSAAERQQDPTLAQALHVMNGETINRKLMAPENRIAALIASGASDEAIVDYLYVASYSRVPSETERARLLAALRTAAGSGEVDARRQVFEDLAWAIFTSKEFLFNH